MGLYLGVVFLTLYVIVTRESGFEPVIVLVVSSEISKDHEGIKI